MTFPPPGLLPKPLNQYGSISGCDLWDAVDAAATLLNPCFDVYQVATTYPTLFGALGFPSLMCKFCGGCSIDIQHNTQT